MLLSAGCTPNPIMVFRYIARQEEHPRKRTFEEVDRQVLARSEISFEESFPSQSSRPSRAGLSGRHWFQGFAKSAHPWLLTLLRTGESEICFLRGGARNVESPGPGLMTRATDRMTSGRTPNNIEARCCVNCSALYSIYFLNYLSSIMDDR